MATRKIFGSLCNCSWTLWPIPIYRWGGAPGHPSPLASQFTSLKIHTMLSFSCTRKQLTYTLVSIDPLLKGNSKGSHQVYPSLDFDGEEAHQIVGWRAREQFCKTRSSILKPGQSQCLPFPGPHEGPILSPQTRPLAGPSQITLGQEKTRLALTQAIGLHFAGPCPGVPRHKRPRPTGSEITCRKSKTTWSSTLFQCHPSHLVQALIRFIFPFPLHGVSSVLRVQLVSRIRNTRQSPWQGGIFLRS